MCSGGPYKRRNTLRRARGWEDVISLGEPSEGFGSGTCSYTQAEVGTESR